MKRLFISLTCLCIAGYVQAQNNSGPLSDNSGWIVDGYYSTYKLTQNEGVSSQIDIYFDGSDDCNAWDAQFVTPCWKNLGKEGDRFKLSFDVKYTGDFDEGRLRIASGKTYPYNPDYNQGNNTQIVNYYGNAIVYNSDFYVGTNWVRYEYSYYLGEEGADSVRLEIDHGYTEGTMSFANITLEINDTVKYQYLKNDKVNTVKTIGFYTYQFDGNTASISKHSFPTDTTAITIPASVTSGGIKYDVKYVNCNFYNLDSLQSITIEGDQNLQYTDLYFTKDSIKYQVVGKNSVSITGTTHLNDFSIPATVTAGNTFAVTSIGERAFYNTALTNANIPATVYNIDNYAFYYCKKLKSVTIPKEVSYIGRNAFYICDSITSITIETEYSNISRATLNFTSDSITYRVIKYDEVELTLFNKKSFNAIPETVTAGSTFKVTTIADNAFRNCTFVVDSIQYSPIDLKSVKVSYCSKLNGGKLVIPSTVTSNGSTFTVTAIGDNALDNSPMSEIIIPETVTTIYGAAFENCDSLKSITIPNSVESINSYAFQYCHNLETVVLPNRLTSIGYRMFYYCSSLKSIVIPNSVTSIDAYAFSNCTSLESIVIPNSVTYISNNVFSYCENLKNIVIGSSLNNVGSSAFAYCDSIENITILNTIPPYAYYTFRDVHDTVFNKMTLRVPQGSKDKYLSDDNYPWNKMNIVEFAVYNVTLEAQSGEATFTGGGLYEAGTNTKAVVCANPNWGYQFVKWSDGNTDNPRTISLTKDTTLTAVFADKFYNVTLLVDNDKHGYITGTTRVREGYWADYYAYGVGEYTFDHWDNGYTSYSRGLSITSDTTLKAFFKKNELHQVTVTSNDYTMGTVSECTSVWSGERTYIRAQANDGFRFVKWSDEYTNSYRNITVVSDTSLVAYFEPVPQCKVRFFVADSCKQMGTVFCAYATVAKGNEVTVEATPNDGYIFKGWYTAKGKQRSSNPILQFNVKRDTTLYAHFAPKPNYVYIPYSGIEKLSIDAGQTVKIYDSEGPERNCLKGGEGQLIITVPKGYCIKISGTSDIHKDDYLAPYDMQTGNFYTRWHGKDTSECVIADTIGALYFENSHSGYKGFELEATAVKWADVIPYNIGLTVNDTALGKASILFAINTDTTNYEIWLYAKNKRGGRFNCWSDGYDWNYHNVDVTSDTSFVAKFDTLKAYTVTIQSADTAMGKVYGDTSGIYYQGEEVDIWANANNKEFSFVKWSDGEIYSNRYFYVQQDTTLTAEFKRNKAYTVNFVSSDTTLGTVLNSGTYYEGQTAYPNVKTKENCFLTNWSDGGEYDWRGVKVVSDTTITANFERMPYKFTVQANDTNMGYAGYYSIQRVTSKIYQATVYTITTPGYVFTNWSDGFVNQHTVYIVSDTVLTANFEPVKYKINYDEGENGMVWARYATMRGDIITMEIRAIPDEGYCFAGWNDTVMQLNRTFAISSDTTIAVRFAKFPYNIEVTCDKAQGSVGYSTQKASLNEPYVHFFATENPGYAFLKWSNGGASKDLYMTLTSDIALEAIFEETAIKVLVSANDTAMGTVSYEVSWWDETATSVDLNAKAKNGYHFVMWSDSILTTRRSEMFKSDTTIIAIFAPNLYKVTVATADATMGTAKAESDSVAYNTTVKLTATAADGYKFVMWSDSVTDNPRNLLVLGDTTVTAIFEKVENKGSAVNENEASALNIFAYGNTIVIENADAEIRVYDVMGHLVTISNDENAEIKINDTGVYIVKVGNIVKRVMIQ